MANLRQTLYAWRDAEAVKRGVELFRVLPNNALDEIVKALPRTKEELTAIKGIKEAKYREFGKAIFAMIDEHVGAEQENSIENTHKIEGEETVFSVSTYLDIVNRELYRLHARVKGEVTSIKFQGSAVYLGLKDAEDESTLSVFMWMRDYTLSGVELVDGMEVVVEGRSEIYKPSGRFNFRAETIELAGVGALKKAYDALKKKLDSEGLFIEERKRALPEYPEHVGLITSKTGAVIHDFLNNLGKFGFKVRFMDSRVEGAVAVKEILAAIKYFSTQPIDTLVIIRGGGSLESLQAFNNEHVVRAIATFPKPVICAIGHDKDLPLAQLVADHAPSTPTATTTLLNRSWEDGIHLVRNFAKDIMSLYQGKLWEEREALGTFDQALRIGFAKISELVTQITREFSAALLRVQKQLATHAEILRGVRIALTRGYAHLFSECEREIAEISRSFRLYNPLRQLKLGYSILSQGGKILRSTTELKLGEYFEARLADGTLEAEVTKITRKEQ